MKKFCFLTIVLAALCLAFPAPGAEPRTWIFAAPDRPALQAQDSVEWVQGESVALEYAIPAPLAEGQTALWEITQGSNLYSYAAAEAGETALRWRLAPDQTTLPPGRYAGRVAVYSTAGGTTTFHRVLAMQGIRVYKGIADFEELQPVPWYDASELAAVEGAISTNAQAIAILQEAVESHGDEINFRRLPASYHRSSGSGVLSPWWDVSAHTVFSGDVEAPALVAPLEAGISSNAAAIADLSGRFLPMWPGWYRLDDGSPSSIDRPGLGIYKPSSPPGAAKELHLSAGGFPLVLQSDSEEGVAIKAEFFDESSGETIRAPLRLEGDVEANGAPVATTNDVAAALAPVEERVSGIEADYLTSADATAFATTGAVAQAAAVANAALPKAGGTLTGELVIGNGGTGNTPYLTFARGTLTDAHDDWRFVGSYGELLVGHGKNSSYNWAYTFRRDGRFVAPAFAGDGSALAVAANNETNALSAWCTRLAALELAAAAETSARTAADSALDGRVGELEELAEEYWCKWTDESISFSQTNWIPTDLPARTVWCFVSYTATNSAPYFALQSFEPATNCTIHLVFWKPTGSPGFYVVSANGKNLAYTSTANAQYRDVVLSYRCGIGWIVVAYTMPLYAAVAKGGVRYLDYPLPEDERFAPVIEPAAQSLSLSTSPALLSPAALHLEEEPLDEPDFDAPQDPETDR